VSGIVTPRHLRRAILAVAALVVIVAVGLAFLFFSNPDGLRGTFSPPSEPERALTLADEFVAAQHPGYVGAARRLVPATDEGQRVFVVRYTRTASDGSADRLLVLIDPLTEEARELRTGGPQ
jgi:hypothetical protein